MQYLYLLHFDTPLRHALHYIGTTENLPLRLRDHARGNGAKITAACKDAGIGWTLSRLWYGHFRLEHAFKSRKNAKLYCPTCNPYPAVLAGMDSVPIGLLSIPLHSSEFATLTD